MYLPVSARPPNSHLRQSAVWALGKLYLPPLPASGRQIPNDSQPTLGNTFSWMSLPLSLNHGRVSIVLWRGAQIRNTQKAHSFFVVSNGPSSQFHVGWFTPAIFSFFWPPRGAWHGVTLVYHWLYRMRP